MSESKKRGGRKPNSLKITAVPTTLPREVAIRRLAAALDILVRVGRRLDQSERAVREEKMTSQEERFGIQWTPWRPLLGSWLIGGGIPDGPGLYRIRRVGRDDLDYIGQTGAGSAQLRGRLGMLRGVWGEAMPYRDPHTAGPALWALRHSAGCDFEVSVAPVSGGDTRWRKGLECLAIALYRQERGMSPNVNFGRMPAGYRMSSGNNARLTAAGKRQTGGLWDEALACHLPGVGPVGPLAEEATGEAWCGHSWSPWSRAGDGLPASALGLYRLRDTEDQDALVYIGQGAIASRIRAHLAKGRTVGHSQAAFFGAAGMEASWVAGEFVEHQRLELENDLIGVYVLATGRIPSAQFLA